jgi:hypothetical protein
VIEVFPMPRATRQRVTGITVAIASLGLLLAAAPFLPRGGDDNGAVRPSAADDAAALAHATAGTSAVTPAAQAEIDKIVNQGLTVGRTLTGRATPAALVSTQIRCAEFEGQRYCLHSGWTEESPTAVVAAATAEANQINLRPALRVTGTGDADLLTTLEASARMSATARAASERAELTAAAQAVAKVWLIRNQIEGVPLPAGFLQRHPEIRTQSASTSSQPLAKASATPTAKQTATAASSPTSSPTKATTSATSTPSATPTTKSWGDYPASARILDKHDVAEQTRTYYCGPTSMQMIAWNWSGREHSQEYWASKLGTTSSGTSITDMVRVTNAYTGWDQEKFAGPYIVLDVKNYSYGQWWLLNMRHLVDYKAPLIFHPILLKQFYPYLDDDASGHYQVGRGYDKKGDRPNLISYFEPWNQQRFDPSEPYIARVQWRDAYKSYRGNEAHYAHNIGV